MSSNRRAVPVLAVVFFGAAALGQDAAKKDEAPKSASTDDTAKKLDALLADLGKKLGAVKTLRSRFEQKKRLEVFEDVVTSEGTLAVAVPDKLRWEYVKPVKSVLTVNGKQAQRERTSRKGETTRRTYVLDDEPVTAITAQQVFLWSRGDFSKARESYDLSLVSEKPVVVKATPKAERMREIVASIELTFGDDRRSLAAVSIVEKGGAKTTITFLDVEIDPALPEALFKIEK